MSERLTAEREARLRGYANRNLTISPAELQEVFDELDAVRAELREAQKEVADWKEKFFRSRSLLED